jgi:hypothetical protein
LFGARLQFKQEALPPHHRFCFQPLPKKKFSYIDTASAVLYFLQDSREGKSNSQKRHTYASLGHPSHPNSNPPDKPKYAQSAAMNRISQEFDRCVFNGTTSPPFSP